MKDDQVLSVAINKAIQGDNTDQKKTSTSEMQQFFYQPLSSESRIKFFIKHE